MAGEPALKFYQACEPDTVAQGGDGNLAKRERVA